MPIENSLHAFLSLVFRYFSPFHLFPFISVLFTTLSFSMFFWNNYCRWCHTNKTREENKLTRSRFNFHELMEKSTYRSARTSNSLSHSSLSRIPNTFFSFFSPLVSRSLSLLHSVLFSRYIYRLLIFCCWQIGPCPKIEPSNPMATLFFKHLITSSIEKTIESKQSKCITQISFTWYSSIFVGKSIVRKFIHSIYKERVLSGFSIEILRFC